MLSALKSGIEALLQSKSFMGMFVGMLVTLVAKVGLEVDETTMWQLVGIVGGFFGVQVSAQIGKEKAKVISDETTN